MIFRNKTVKEAVTASFTEIHYGIVRALVDALWLTVDGVQKSDNHRYTGSFSGLRMFARMTFNAASISEREPVLERK